MIVEILLLKIAVHLNFCHLLLTSLCRNAFVGIIRKGGLPSLYVGWGAVLCRNIPQSIIKVWSFKRYYFGLVNIFYVNHCILLY